MGFNWKKAAGIMINPTMALGTGLSMGSDIYAAREQRKATEEANRQAMDIHLRNEAQQREFAQHGIRWKVEDAIAAGIHPLYALGAQGASYSPSSPQIFADDSKATMARNMGQSLSRAAQATMTLPERRATELNLRNMELQNKLLESQISMIGRPTNPPMPSDSELSPWGPVIPGQGNSTRTGSITEQPMPRTVSHPGRPYQDPAHVADFGFVRTPYGLAIIPSRDVKERIEDQLIPELSWAVRNNILPNISKNFPEPRVEYYPLPRHYRDQGYRSWKWNYLLQQFTPSKKPPRDYKYKGVK